MSEIKTTTETQPAKGTIQTSVELHTEPNGASKTRTLRVTTETLAGTADYFAATGISTS